MQKTADRIGLIGQNGCGKTTLMKAVMGVEDFQDGSIHIRKDARLGYQDQIPEYNEETTVLDVLQSAFDDIFRIKRNMKQLEEQFEYLKDADLDKALVNYGKMAKQFESVGGYEVETKISTILGNVD